VKESEDSDTDSRVYVLDTSCVINGYSSRSRNQYTVPEVVNEAKSLIASASVGAFIDTGSLKVWDASESSIEVVEKGLERIGGRLSDTDIRVIALALDLRERGLEPVILTDDYGLQNMADVLDLEFSSIMTDGIRSVYHWRKICPACGRECGREKVFCPVCGSRLKTTIVEKPL